jgi:hypothetical protein
MVNYTTVGKCSPFYVEADLYTFCGFQSLWQDSVTSLLVRHRDAFVDSSLIVARVLAETG